MISFKQFLNKKVLTISALAKKHNVSLNFMQKQLEHGIKIEHEHTTKVNIARHIALAHLGEDPKYYIKLIKIKL